MTARDRIEPWVVERDDLLQETPVFSLRRRESRSAVDPSRRGTFLYADVRDWVNVIALTPDGDVVLVEQYRHGLNEVTLEIPGGIVDPGETFEDAAVRELLEETGYAGDAPERIGTVSSNPALMNNRCATVLIRNARCVAEPSPDSHEEIVVRLASKAKVDAGIQTGEIHHGLVVAAWMHLALWARRTAVSEFGGYSNSDATGPRASDPDEAL